MELERLKKVSAALMPVNCSIWSITTTRAQRQPSCAHLGMVRSTLRNMARIDALYLENPCRGNRQIVDYLATEGIPISRDRVRNLMRRIGLRAI